MPQSLVASGVMVRLRISAERRCVTTLWADVFGFDRLFSGMGWGRDWLLFEVLGAEPVVVAQGHRLRKLVPLSVFLERSRNLSAITRAIAESVEQRQRLVLPTAERGELIHCEPVLMTDKVVHGVQVWTGKPGVRPPGRVLPGATHWDITSGIAADTAQALVNSGKDPATEATHGRSFAEDIPTRRWNPHESQVLARTIDFRPGITFCSTWDIEDARGNSIRASFVSRAMLEWHSDGTQHRVFRAMNWRVPSASKAVDSPDLARQVLYGMAQDGVYRALVDLRTWKLLKWLDAPCPHFDWRGSDVGRPLVHPEDRQLLGSAVRKSSSRAAAVAVLRLRNDFGGWTPIHLTLYEIELEPNVVAGLLFARLPTPSELSGLPVTLGTGETETADT